MATQHTECERCGRPCDDASASSRITWSHPTEYAHRLLCARCWRFVIDTFGGWPDDVPPHWWSGSEPLRDVWTKYRKDNP